MRDFSYYVCSKGSGSSLWWYKRSIEYAISHCSKEWTIRQRYVVQVAFRDLQGLNRAVSILNMVRKQEENYNEVDGKQRCLMNFPAQCRMAVEKYKDPGP